MKKLPLHLEGFLENESGQDLIEYALVAGVLGLGAIVTLKGVANIVANVFGSAGNTLTNSV